MRKLSMAVGIVAVLATMTGSVATGSGAHAASTYSTTTAWSWSFSDLPGTPGADQWVQASMAGNTRGDAGGSLLLRKSGSTFVLAHFTGTRYRVELVRGGVQTVVVDRPLSVTAAGTARAEIAGSTLRAYWNGALVDASTLAALGTFTGTGSGLGVWQDRSYAVTITDAESGALAAPPVAVPVAGATWSTTTAWSWVYRDIATLPAADGFLQAAVSGVTDKDKNAALLLRRSGTSFVQATFSGTRYQVSLVRGGVADRLVDLPWTSGAGTARAEISGSTVRGYWNGALVATTAVPGSELLTGRGAGLGIWQNTASAVKVTSPTTGTVAPVVGAPSVLPPPVLTAPPAAPAPAAGGTSAATRLYGTPRSGLPWHSGFWTGGYKSTARMQAVESWRGSRTDLATTYLTHESWSAIAGSEWSISTFDGYGGRLSLGLPLLPDDRRGQWGDILSGSKDDVFRTVARQLVRHGRGDTVVRVGWEANGDWYPWAVTAGTADQYRQAFRRVVTLMRAEAPGLTFWQDLAAGTAIAGQTDRMDPLTKLYAGNDVVDGISVDHYDFYGMAARTLSQWPTAIRPAGAAGLQEAADFARAKGKGFAVPEWGLHGVQGNGDNPFFMTQMWGFFQANKDVLVYESYFNEPDSYIRNAIWDANQNPLSATVYRDLW